VELTVWVDAWQLECCGAIFSKKSTASFRLGPANQGRLDALLGTSAPHLSGADEAHGAVPEDVPLTTGLVRSIRAIYAPVPEVVGRGLIAPVRAADLQPPQRDGKRLIGYVVGLRVSGTSAAMLRIGGSRRSPAAP
jgi:hypothetical protein